MAAGCDMMKWLAGEYSIQRMVAVVAWHRMHKVVGMHSSDAESKEIKRRGNKGDSG